MEPGNIAKVVWPLALGGLAFSLAAGRSQRGWGPLAFGAVGAYATYWAMQNQKDYVSLRLFGHTDVIPF